MNDSLTPNDEPLPYIKRTRYYYQVLGYGKPYEWAQFDEVPFAKLKRPLSESTVSIVTTAAQYQADKGDQRVSAPYNASAKFYSVYTLPTDVEPDLRISHVGIDRNHTIEDDIGAFFPLKALKQAKTNGLIGRLSERFYGLPTNRSKRTTIEIDCKALIQQCETDKVDVVLLAPNCPVCHQSVSLAARALEEKGIVTVVIGCAKDIVETVGVPRFLFNDLPLGNAAGLPGDVASQELVLKLALALAESAIEPRTTIQSPLTWRGKRDWKDDYSNPDKLSADELAQRRIEFDEGKRIAKLKREN